MVLCAVPISLILIILITRVWTTINYRLSIRPFQSSKSSHPAVPPPLPYSLPFLGHALSWTTTTPGAYFRVLQSHFASYPFLGAITLSLAGNRAHILNSPDLVTKLFKSKGVSRRRFNRDIMLKAMGLPQADDAQVFGDMGTGGKGPQPMESPSHEINREFLLKQENTNLLTVKFMEVFCEEIQKMGHGQTEWQEPLYTCLRERMFRASTSALYGSEILKMYPQLSRFYWDFDNGVLARLFGIPRFMNPEAYHSLDVILDMWEKWVKVVRKTYQDEPPRSSEWDQLMGSQVVRERHRMYQVLGASDRGRASLDLGFLFG
jgi:hypothetical protein